MLIELHIKNFILIDELRIGFKKGLNVITGETGAGKSILIKAVDIAIGGKTGKDLLRPGSTKAEIEIAFHVEDEEIIKDLQNQYGLSFADEPVIVFKREILENGRTVSRINGNITSVEAIRKISASLIDIHGQHEHQSLLKKENYLGLLDRSISTEHNANIGMLSSICSEIKSLERLIKKHRETSQKNEREIDFYRYQLKEINEINLSIGEDNDLSREYDFIKNGEAIHRNCTETLRVISPDFDDEFNATDLMDKAISLISNIQSFSEELSEIHSKMHEAHYLIEDITTNLRHFSDNFSYDYNRLEYVEARIDAINNMKMKYGNTIDEILLYRDNIEQRLNEYIHSDEQIEVYKNLYKAKLEEYKRLASSISSKRHLASKVLSEKVLSELKELNLEKAEFDISLNTDKTRISVSGYEDVDFLISTNPGQKAKSLSKIASGGEISRIMLAMKVIMSKMDTIDTIIFDEIDTGVSGKTAKKVAEKLYKTSMSTQVICITHLPQIAVMGDYHILIEKSVTINSTTTHVKALETSEKVKEISRLLDGNIDSEISTDHAKKLISSIKEEKGLASGDYKEGDKL